MVRRSEFDRGRPDPPPELAHQFIPSDDFEFSVVADRKVHQPGEVPVRHAVYDNLGDANLHIAKLRVESGVHPNLKVITQPQGTAYRDLMEGRIKMREGAPWPAAPKKERR